MKLYLSFVSVLLSPVVLCAQAPRAPASGPQAKVGITLVGGDFDHASVVDPPSWAVQADTTMDWSDKFGMGVDLTYGRLNIPFNQSHTLALLVGPTLYRPLDRSARMYVHAFVGAARSAGPLSIDRKTELAWKAGSGIEVLMFGPVHMRLGVDYLRSLDATPALDIRGQNHIRAVLGIQYVFGDKSRYKPRR